MSYHLQIVYVFASSGSGMVSFSIESAVLDVDFSWCEKEANRIETDGVV